MYIITEEDEKLLATLGPYQQAVLRLLAEVPKGKVVTYSDLAKELALRDSKYSPTASRAVGTTMRNNLCGPRIPCHRVIKSDGGIGNFRGGEPGAVKEKAKMLREEGVEVVKNKINLKRFRHKFR